MLSDTDLAAIHDLARLTDEMGRNGDWAAGEHLIADDIRMVFPEQPPILGKEGWREFVAPIGPMPRIETVFDEVDGAGDMAYVWGHQDFTMDLDGDLHTNTGWFLIILRKNDAGTWQYSREAVTFEKPLAL